MGWGMRGVRLGMLGSPHLGPRYAEHHPGLPASLGGQAVPPPALTGDRVGQRGKVPRHILLVAMAIL